jgi:formate dehydrogenase (coenzyme F420) beta subunit
MKALVDKAKQLLHDGTVSCLIGYAPNSESRRLHPFIAKNIQEAERLTFNHYALNNLSAFLNIITKSYPGRIGIFAKGCDVASIYRTIKEDQLDRESIYIIGIECHGVVEDYLKKWDVENIANKCAGCLLQTPILVDEIISLSREEVTEDDKLVA